MKLLILSFIIQIAQTANTIIISNNHEKMAFSTRNDGPTPIYTSINICNNNVKTIGGSNISFDNSCKTLSISSNSVTSSSASHSHLGKYYYDVTFVALIILCFM
ncbi:hypothetical protein CONCODRAFT_12980 [Conidiobolus coronatus NRRL 28638]|uniref:Uncharacterized protein n=1 Tax=Conidiobolus coronatus (strain ATCC 28846 / CBS 209.66 / NRRL 28638) TaxID=796925 RepID=A0A137NRV8_CONC2|nr:hypothetical protein CONCODRAFT_12980 [Conidiobolus coronatus NRRL 28638]|eukprot:KXN65422.1 hypothetical protein CONCODRAFT_12980 [Conidiobolus coronatus NRRL 28638]